MSKILHSKANLEGTSLFSQLREALLKVNTILIKWPTLAQLTKISVYNFF